MIALYIEKGLSKINDKILYSCDFIFTTLGLEYSIIKHIHELKKGDILFYYGLIRPNVQEAYVLALNRILIFMPIESFLYDQSQWNTTPFDDYDKRICFGKPIPVLSSSHFDDPVNFIKKKDLNYCMFNFDILGNIFFYLNSDLVDPCKQNLSLRNYNNRKNYSKTPYVNLLVKYFHMIIKKLVESKESQYLIRKVFWPENQCMALSITHNVAMLQKWNLQKIFKTILWDLLTFFKIKKNLNDIISILKFLFSNYEEYWNFESIEKIENLYRINSSYFWYLEESGNNNCDYDFKSEDIQAEMDNQIKQNSEIGLLVNTRTSKINQHIDEILKTINSTSVGIRMLDIDQPLRQNCSAVNFDSISYDSSVVPDNLSEIKNNIALPYFLYTEADKQDHDYLNNKLCLEIPLVFSDDLLNISKFRTIKVDVADNVISELIDKIEMGEGLLTLNFSVHNFTNIRYISDLFNRILNSLTKKNVYIDNLINIARWWKLRSSIKITERETDFEVYFPSKVDKLTLKVIGKVKVRSSVKENVEIDNDKIIFQNVKADARLRFDIIN